MGIKSRSKNGNLELTKRVPKKYWAVEARRAIWITLNTDSRTEAEERAKTAWNALIQEWEARLNGTSQEPEKRWEASRDLADAKGFAYLDAELDLHRFCSGVLLMLCGGFFERHG